MLIETLTTLFNRDLKRLRSEIELYDHEEDVWQTKGEINNSAGNLCLHLIGNLNTYLGKELGGTGYVRNRDEEFSLKNIPKQELLAKVDDTIKIVELVLNNLDEEVLEKEYPVIVFEHKMSVGYFLVHLATHLSYHLGQINYHRRLIENRRK
jgi:uncharacterized damage-inducible protein DinB